MDEPRTRRQSLIVRIVGAYLFLGGALVAAVALTLWQVDRQTADGELINVAGSQRMLSQRMALNALALAAGETDVAGTLREDLARFSGQLTALRQGDPQRGFPPPPPEAAQALAAAAEVWKPMRADIESILAASEGDRELRLALARLREGEAQLRAEAETLVDALSTHGAPARALDVAGSLRMLSLRLVKHGLEVAEGGGLEAGRALRETAGTFTRRLQGLRSGDTGLELAALPAGFAPALEQLSTRWRPVQAQALIVAERAESCAETQAAGFRTVAASREVLRESHRAVEAFAGEAGAKVNTLVSLLLLLIGVGVLLTAAAAWMAARKLLPLRELERVASRIAGGDLRHDVAVSGEDEVGNLAGAFRAMLGEIRDYARRANAVAQALGSATSQISSSLQENLSTLSSQAAAIAEATSSLEELRASALENDRRAQEVLARNTETVGGMNQVQLQVQDIATSIVALSEKTQQIGEILDSVSDIADQSNLLAVNASIEASKAGEFGRGFEVVALEVRNLAQQSQRSTLSIREQLRDIQRAMNSAVMTTEEGTKRVQRQTDALNGATQAVEHIVHSTREQTRAIEQIAESVRSVSESVSQSKASSGQLSDASVTLLTQAQDLRSAVERFQA